MSVGRPNRKLSDTSLTFRVIDRHLIFSQWTDWLYSGSLDEVWTETCFALKAFLMCFFDPRVVLRTHCQAGSQLIYCTTTFAALSSALATDSKNPFDLGLCAGPLLYYNSNLSTSNRSGWGAVLLFACSQRQARRVVCVNYSLRDDILHRLRLLYDFY